MKICRIVYEMPPPWDGLAPHPYEITVAQAKKGHEITVFSGRWPGSGPVENIKGVKYIHILREPFPATISFTSSVVLFFKYLRWRMHNTPDILHCHGHFAVWIYFYRNILIRFFPWHSELKIPLVAHFHNTAKGRWESFIKEDKYISPHSRFLQWPMSVFSDKLAVKTASACIFVSSDTREEAIKYYKPDERRCFVVETGVNTDLFHPINQLERDKSRKEVGLDSFDKVILNLGKVVERKNVHLVVEALNFLPPHYKLILVGTGDKAYTNVVNQKIANLGLDNRVIKMGYTPYPLNPIAYQISDIFVLPSSWEGLPKAVMQALAVGIPAVVYGFKLQDELNGLIYLNDIEPQTIANAIKTAIEGQQTVDVQKVATKYSWDERIKEIEIIYAFAKQNYIL